MATFYGLCLCIHYLGDVNSALHCSVTCPPEGGVVDPADSSASWSLPHCVEVYPPLTRQHWTVMGASDSELFDANVSS